MTDQDDYDRLPDETRKDFARRLSHVTSEVGLLRRDVAEMREACKRDLLGSASEPGVVVRLDRLEQAQIRNIEELRRWIGFAKWITGGSLAAGIAALAAALKAYGSTQ